MHPFHILNIRSIHHSTCPREYFQLRGLLRTLVKQNILQWRIVTLRAGLPGLSLRRYCLLCTSTATLRSWSQTPPSGSWGRPCCGENWSTSIDLCIATSEVTWNYTSQSAVYQMFYFKFSPNGEERKLLSDMLSAMAHSQWKVAKNCQ
jgi:hypothetical protein